MRLHFNKSNGIFSVRRVDRSTVAATGRNEKLPLIGDTFELSPKVHLLVTRGLYVEAKTKSRPFVPAVVTNWPRLRLLWERFKEVTND